MPDKLITMDEIARLANVSKPTVSRALRNSALVRPETRERILEIAEQHGYAINRNAQKLRHKRVDTIAVMLDFASHDKQQVNDPFIFELLAGISEALSVRSQDLLLTPPNLTSLRDYKEMIAARAVDGFIFIGEGYRQPLFLQIAKAQLPFVVWGAEDNTGQYCSVGSDNLMGGKLAGEYLLEKGCRRIAFAGNLTHREIKLRYDGLCQKIEEAGEDVSVSNIHVEYCSYQSSYPSAVNYLTRGPMPLDGLFAYSDTGAMAFINAFREKGIRVPEDICIVGYNDLPISAHFYPAITTIRQDTHFAGSLLVERLIQILDGARPNSVLLPTKLIARAT